MVNHTNLLLLSKFKCIEQHVSAHESYLQAVHCACFTLI